MATRRAGLVHERDSAALASGIGVWWVRQTFVRTPLELARPSLITVLVVLIAGLLIAIPKDVEWSRSRRHGRRLKGPELVSVGQFNRRTRANGVAFAQTARLPGSGWASTGARNSAHDRVEPSADHG